jgi:ribose transport system permease protein
MPFNDEVTTTTGDPVNRAAGHAADGPPASGAGAAWPANSAHRGLARLSVTPKSMSPTAMLIAGSLAIIVFFSIYLRNSGFLSVGNVQAVIAQATVISILAVGNVFVLTAGEIDLSFANVAPLSGVILALVAPDIGIVPAVVVALLAGAMVGLVNGLITVRIGVPSFIVTLGMMEVINGVTQWISNQASLPVTNSVFDSIFGSAQVGPISVLVFWTIGIGILGAWLLQRAVFGRVTAATGGNETAARYSGIRTGRVRVSVFVLNGLLAALGGLLYVGQLRGASYQYGGSSALILTLAAVIIGGTAMSGGRGRILGAIVGSLLLGFIANGLVMMGLSIEAQLALTGVIIVAAVTVSGRMKGRT